MSSRITAVGREVQCNQPGVAVLWSLTFFMLTLEGFRKASNEVDVWVLAIIPMCEVSNALREDLVGSSECNVELEKLSRSTQLTTARTVVRDTAKTGHRAP